jgi:thiol-disulfide isomerase/thioredoxin
VAQAGAPKPENSSPEEEEARALGNAVRSAQGNPQALIQNLEEFLARFPKTPRREQVLRTIYQQALATNVPAKAISAGERLLEFSPDDPSLLSTLVELLGRYPPTDGHSQQRALYYATRLVEQTERDGKQSPPSGVSEEKWEQSQSLMRATAYLMRGKIYTRMGKTASAVAELQKSYEAYPTSQVAERLGDLLASSGQADRALDYYVTAFAFPEKEADPTGREQLRLKLGSLYLAQHPSEAGLGDLILKRYDELTRMLAPRMKSRGDPNVDLHDPFDFVLERPDGSAMKMADYRGKVVVMEFWATWCSPCRLEGKLLERVWEEFRQDARAVFLAVNVDEDRNMVPSFLQEEGWTIPVAYAQGIDRLLRVRAIPTLLVFDSTGRVVFRQQGLDLSSFVETVEKKVREALAPASATPLSGTR